MAARVERMLLFAPDSVARAAAARARRPEERWLLRQPRRIRESFAREVLRAPDREHAQQVWMLRQPAAVRESYIAQVLLADRQ